MGFFFKKKFRPQDCVKFHYEVYIGKAYNKTESDLLRLLEEVMSCDHLSGRPNQASMVLTNAFLPKILTFPDTVSLYFDRKKKETQTDLFFSGLVDKS